jgi:hypothetical protein
MPLIPSRQLYERMVVTSPGPAAAPTRGTEQPPRTLRTGIALGPAALDELLLRRRACRDFADRPLEAAALTAIASAAFETTMTISLVACAYRVSGLDVGAYMFRPRLAEPWQAIPPDAGWPDDGLTCLRNTYAKAPVLILACAGLERACLRPRGYPSALALAAATAYQAWLTSMTHGMDGCLFGRADPRVATLVVPGCPEPLRQLVTLAIGYGRAVTG